MEISLCVVLIEGFLFKYLLGWYTIYRSLFSQHNVTMYKAGNRVINPIHYIVTDDYK